MKLNHDMDILISRMRWNFSPRLVSRVNKELDNELNSRLRAVFANNFAMEQPIIKLRLHYK
jgi:hypothetical protein